MPIIFVGETGFVLRCVNNHAQGEVPETTMRKIPDRVLLPIGLKTVLPVTAYRCEVCRYVELYCDKQ